MENCLQKKTVMTSRYGEVENQIFLFHKITFSLYSTYSPYILMLRLSTFPFKTLKTQPKVSDNKSTSILLQ
jgi:hypothetical protein